MLNTAKKLTDLIKMDTDKITEREIKGFLDSNVSVIC